MIRSIALFVLLLLPWVAVSKHGGVWVWPAFILACAQGLWGAWVAVAPGQRPDHWSQSFFLAGVVGSFIATFGWMDHLLLGQLRFWAPFCLLMAYRTMKTRRRTVAPADA